MAAALTRQTATGLVAVLDQLGGALPELLPGYRVKILDGNCLAKTEHRLKELRLLDASPLPGKSLVVLDPARMLVADVFPCEDGHTQERALLEQVLPTVAANDLWIGDRNFCRRVELRLRTPTRDGEAVIQLLTNLPLRVASTRVVAQLDRERWTIEGAFQVLEAALASEQPRLGYPQAGLLAFCVALVAYNVLAVVRAALRAAHGREAEEKVSTYYLAAELKGVYQGMMIALPAADRQPLQSMSAANLATVLKALARRVDLSRYARSPRGPKKPRPARRHCKAKPHVSTARLIANRRKKKPSP